MPHPDPTRELFLDYLLENLSEEQRESVDNALIEDQDFSLAFKELEYDLLEDLTSKRLTGEENRRVEEALLRFPHLREAVGMASAFRRINTRSTAPPVLRPSPIAPKRAWWHSRLILASAFAVLVICFLISIRLLNSHFNPAAHITASVPTKETPASAPATDAPVATPEAPRASSEHKPPPSLHRDQTESVAVLLLPELVRGQQPLTVDLHKGIHGIEVQYPLPADTTAEGYSIDATNMDNQQVLHGSPKPALKIDGKSVAIFSFDATGFLDGQYQFSLHKPDGTSSFGVSIRRN